jgi:predicted RNA-binding Zn ribbon-like protein
MTAQPESPEMPKSRAGSLHLLGGRLCLDFANTTSGRGGSHCLEHLQAYGNLIDWCRHTGMISSARGTQLKRAAARAPAAAQHVLDQAKDLREAIYGVFTAAGQCRQIPSDLLETLNRAVADAAAHRWICPSPAGFAWRWRAAPDDLGVVLRPVALSAAELLVNLDRRRLKQCAGQHCGWLFLDETRSRTRRWCDMRVCGSRAKIRRFRQRRRRRVGSAGKS